MTALTASASAFRVPAELQELCSSRAGAYELPADATTAQVNEGWKLLRALEAEVGSWMRAEHRAERGDEGASASDFYLDTARKLAAAAQDLAEALRAASERLDGAR